MRWEDLEQERCSIARTLAVIGDRWTLLILRDCFLGVRRFEDFQARIGVTRHILADRLRKLTAHGVLARVRYQDHPPRSEYRLTRKGLDLHPVLLGLAHWGDTHVSSPEGPPVVHVHRGCGHAMRPVLTCSECGEGVTARDIDARAAPGAPPPGAVGRRRDAGGTSS